MKRDKIQISYNELHEFDGVLTHTPFKLKEPVTWLSWFIRVFERNYYNHCKVILEVSDYLLDYAKQKNINTFGAKIGDFCIIEALAEGVELDFDIRNNLIGKDLIIKRSKLIDNLITSEEKIAYRTRAYFTIDKKYDFKGCLIWQMLKQISEVVDTDSDIWIGEKGVQATRRFYCSKVFSFIHLPIYQSHFCDIAPDDIDKDESLITIKDGILTDII